MFSQLFLPVGTQLEPVVFTVLPKRVIYQLSEPQIVVNDSTLILNEWWVWVALLIDFKSFRTFTGPLFLIQITGREVLCGSTVHKTGSSKIIPKKSLIFYKKYSTLRDGRHLGRYFHLSWDKMLPSFVKYCWKACKIYLQLIRISCFRHFITVSTLGYVWLYQQEINILSFSNILSTLHVCRILYESLYSSDFNKSSLD